MQDDNQGAAAFKTSERNRNETEVAGRSIYWMRIFTAEPPGSSAGAPYVIARLWNGAVEGKTDYYVAVKPDNWPRSAGTPIFATRPEGGTGVTHSNGKPIEWAEMAGGGISVKYARAVANLAAPAASIAATPVQDAIGTAYVPPRADIVLQLTSNNVAHGFLSSVAAGDVFAYVSDQGLNIIVGSLPITGTLGATNALVQNISADGSLGIDWLRAHAYDPIP